MSIQDKIKAERITAMKSGDKSRRDAIALILAAFTQTEIDSRKALTDEDAINLLTKMKKMRQESIRMYETAGASEKAAVELYEISIIDEFLPEQASDDEIAGLIESAISETGATSIKEMGKVLGLIKPKLNGRADMAAVSKLVKDKLGV